MRKLGAVEMPGVSITGIIKLRAIARKRSRIGGFIITNPNYHFSLFPQGHYRDLFGPIKGQ
jgi:hypothetical protein